MLKIQFNFNKVSVKNLFLNTALKTNITKHFSNGAGLVGLNVLRVAMVATARWNQENLFSVIDAGLRYLLQQAPYLIQPNYR